MRSYWKLFNYFFEITKMVYSVDKKNFLSKMFLGLLEIPIPIAQVYIAKLIMDEIGRSLSSNSSAIDSSLIIKYILFEFILVFLSNVISLIKSKIEDKLNVNIEVAYTKKILDKIKKIEFKLIDDPEVSNLISDARSSGLNIIIDMFERGMSIIESVIILISFLGFLISFNWVVAFGLVLITISSFFANLYFSKKSETLRRSLMKKEKEISYLKNLLLMSGNIKEMRTMNSETRISDKFIELFVENRNLRLNLGFNKQVSSFMFNFFEKSLYYVSYSLMVVAVFKKTILLGDLTLYVSVFNKVGSGVNTIFREINSIYSDSLRLENVYKFFDLPEQRNNALDEDLYLKVLKNSTIEFESVSFKYPGSEKYIIKDLSFSLKFGEKIALVGENGAGKSTIINLIIGLYHPTEGVVKIGGEDISLFSRDQLSRLLSVVFQDFINFKFNFKESIYIANPQAENSHYVDSLAKSGADKILDILPLRDNHPLTRYFEDNGVSLSGGQWQKMALARAFIKNGNILILDEPTAAIDANQEYEIFSKFQELTKGRTSILVSHRFSTVRMADRILFLEKGNLIESGTHDELIKLNGKYSEMFNKQSIGYL